jgi:predicted DNA-binding protein (MmcQ/YjbR family)
LENSSEGIERKTNAANKSFAPVISMTRINFNKALEKVRSICLALPETREVEAWGHPTFRAGKKMFASFSEGIEGFALHLKIGFDRQEELLADERFFPTPYSAHQGWVSLRMNHKPDWNEVRNLVREAYCQVALKRMLKALDLI